MTPTPIVALDVATPAAAADLVARLGELCRFYKVGSELFTSAGPVVVQMLRDEGCDVFLDLKLHDIPNTVRRAAEAAAAMGVRLLTVHASGGSAMIEAASRGAGDDCAVLAVTVLTSLDAATLGESWGRDELTIEQEVLRLAGLAHRAGAKGVVCSGREAPAIRARFGDRLVLLVPGVRFADGSADDQARVVSPAAAAAAGATYVVLGRAVTAAPVPAQAMRRALAELASQGVSARS